MNASGPKFEPFVWHLGGGGGVTCYISEHGDVRALYVYFSALSLYDKVCFSASNYKNNPSLHYSHYFNSPLNFQSYFLEPIKLYQKGIFLCQII